MCNFALSISPLKSADRTKSHCWQDGFLAGCEVESELLEPDITILCMKNGTKSIACLMCMVLSCQMFGQMKVYNNGSVTVGANSLNNYLDANAKDAHIVVCNLNGLQLKEYSVEQYGRNIITINANEFVPGMYLYSLLVDGRLIDTKRMVVTSK